MRGEGNRIPNVTLLTIAECLNVWCLNVLIYPLFFLKVLFFSQWVAGAVYIQ